MIKHFALLASLVVAAAPTAAFAASEHVPTADSLKARINRTIHGGKSLKTFYADLVAAYGGSAVKPLLEIAQDRENDDQTRWAALFGLARVAGHDSVGVIRKFMSDSSWMLRDAALKTAAALDARELTPQIEQRLHDDALVVRTTAVETIGSLNIKSAGPKLVDALFDPNNFHGGKALWIHRHILDVFKEWHYSAAAPRLVELLEKSKDDTLRGQVIGTLESLTGKRFKDKTIEQQIYLWKRNTLSEAEF